MEGGKQYTVNSKQILKVGRLTVNRKQLTVLAISFILLVSFVTVAIATGFFGINTTKVSSLEKGLVGHWMLDAENGAKDLTPYGNHGTAQGGITIGGAEDRKGKSGGATEFDGSNDYIDISAPIVSAKGAFTVSLWVYPMDSVSSRALISQYPSSSDSERLFLGIGSNKARLRIGGSNIDSNTILDNNKWYHLVYMRDSDNNVSITINGILDNTGIITTDVSNYNMRIGGSTSSSHFANKIMQDVRIYNRALSEDEIQLLYDSYKPKASASDLNKGLVGHWMLDAENGAKDLTPYGNHGTGQGGITIGGAEDRKGKSGGATSFDGTNDYIDGSFDEILNEGSYSFYVYQSKQTDQCPICQKGIDRMYLFLDTPQIEIGLGSTGNKKTGQAVVLNEWKYYTLTWSSGIYKFYIDGVLKDSGSYSGIVDLSDGIYIGRSSYDNVRYFKGSISDVRIYNRALSDDEIQLLFDSYKPKEASVGNLNKGLVLDMPLTTKHMKSDTIVADRTPYGNDGTLMNGVNITNEGAVFDGVNDYIELVNNKLDNPYPITISLWIKNKNLAQSYSRIFTSSLGFANSFHIVTITGGKIQFGYGNNVAANTRLTNGNPIILNKWQHIITIIESDMDNSKFYLDGEMLEIGRGDGTVLEPGNTRIGSSSNGKLPFYGEVSNVRIYNRALSDEEVKLLYEKGRW